MSNTKAEVASILSEDASVEDMQYDLSVLQKVKRGLDRADSEGTVSHEDAKARLSKCLPHHPDSP